MAQYRYPYRRKKARVATTIFTHIGPALTETERRELRIRVLRDMRRRGELTDKDWPLWCDRGKDYETESREDK